MRGRDARRPSKRWPAAGSALVGFALLMGGLAPAAAVQPFDEDDAPAAPVEGAYCPRVVAENRGELCDLLEDQRAEVLARLVVERAKRVLLAERADFLVLDEIDEIESESSGDPSIDSGEALAREKARVVRELTPAFRTIEPVSLPELADRIVRDALDRLEAGR